MSPTAQSAFFPRPQSQAGNHADSGARSPTGENVPRPESRMSAGLERGMTSPELPFDNVLDYAKLNSPRHQGTRSDTFGTPSRLHRRSEAAKADGRAMHEIFEHGFGRSVSNLGKGIVEEVRAELRQALIYLRKEVHESLEGVSEHRDAIAKDSLQRILEKVQEVHEQTAKPPVIDMAQVFNELQKIQQDIVCSGESQQNEIQRAMTQNLDDKLFQTVEQVSSEIREANVEQARGTAAEVMHLREEVQQMQKEALTIRELVGRSEAKLESMTTEQQMLSSTNQRIAMMMENLQLQSETHFTSFAPNFLEQMKAMTIDFDPVLEAVNKVASKSTTDMRQLQLVLGEIGKVQQHLNTDFIKIMDENHHEHEEGDPLRVREFFTQTEAVPTIDRGMVTDFWEPKQAKSKSKPKQVKKAPDEAERAKAKKKPKNVIDGDAMKSQMQAALIKGEYNVSNYYHTTGCAQAIARSIIFDNFTFFAIFANACWIAVDVDHNHASVLVEAHPIFQVMENCFCAYFTGELVIRFLAFQNKINCCKDGWFVFDSFLVILMIFETWVLSLVILILDQQGETGVGNLSILRVARMVKLARISRMARLLRSVPELVILIKTIGVASRSVFFFFIFWLIIIYIFALGFRQVTKGTDVGDEYFQSVPDAMNTLLLDGILPANGKFVNALTQANPWLWPIIIVFILLAVLTVMNIMVGTLVEIVGVVASTEKERMTVMSVKTELEDSLEELGVDPHKPLPQEEFQKILMHPSMIDVIQDLGVDPAAIVDTTDLIYSDMERDAEEEAGKVGDIGELPPPGLSFEVFIEVVLKMRGKNTATVKDLKELSRVMKGIIGKMEENMTRSLTKINLHLQAQRAREADDGSSDNGDLTTITEFLGGRIYDDDDPDNSRRPSNASDEGIDPATGKQTSLNDFLARQSVRPGQSSP